jgi:hypothetical protein
MANEVKDLSALDTVRRFFGKPTLLEQMKAAKAPKQATPSRLSPGTALRQRQDTLDAAMKELNRQSGTK